MDSTRVFLRRRGGGVKWMPLVAAARPRADRTGSPEAPGAPDGPRRLAAGDPSPAPGRIDSMEETAVAAVAASPRRRSRFLPGGAPARPWGPAFGLLVLHWPATSPSPGPVT